MQGQSIISPNLRHTTRCKPSPPKVKRVMTIKKNGVRRMFAIVSGLVLSVSGPVISNVGRI